MAKKESTIKEKRKKRNQTVSLQIKNVRWLLMKCTLAQDITTSAGNVEKIREKSVHCVLHAPSTRAQRQIKKKKTAGRGKKK